MATVSKSLNIQTEGVYTVELNVIPDGATVTPVNDIQTWLHCAGIYDKSYTTLNEVLGDSSTLLALISSNNAVDYMARSTDWAGNGLIPVMTSNTTPSGVCSCYPTNSASANAPFKAFDGDDTTTCTPGSDSTFTTNSYVAYQFSTPTVARKCTFTYINNSRMKNYKIQGSTNGATWVDLASGTATGGGGYVTETKTFNNNTAYNYYRIIATTGYSYAMSIMAFQLYTLQTSVVDNQTAMGYIGNNNYCANKLLANSTWCTAICNSTYFESVLTTKIPTMTSNTTPSGVASAHTSQNTSQNFRPAYMAFDNNDETYWQAAESETYSNNVWIKYKFASKVCVKRIRLSNFPNSSGSYGDYHQTKEVSLYGSNNDSSYTLIGTYTVPRMGGGAIVASIPTNTKYQYYRFNVNDSYYGNNNYIVCLNSAMLWGRA